MNRNEDHSPELISLAKKYSGAFLDVAYGKEPWLKYGKDRNWIVFDQGDMTGIKTESQQRNVRSFFNRGYKLQELGLFKEFLEGAKDMVFMRHLIREALEISR